MLYSKNRKKMSKLNQTHYQIVKNPIANLIISKVYHKSKQKQK